jgi:tetratricopeptide (TPR) repeat protein
MGDEAGQVYLLVNLAVVMYQRDELEATEKLLLEGLELARKTGEHYIEPALLSQLGLLALKNSQPQKAIEYAEQALSKRMALNLRIWTTDNLATLAQAHWQLGNQSTALEFAHQALALLDECGGQGPECPQQDYFNCYQVLLAAGETEPARWALRNANRLVSEHANQITDPALRQSFLENVPINRQITQAVSLTPPGDQ